MLDDALKIIAPLVTAVAGALCAAFIPLLRQNQRIQQEVELGIKEVDRIDKTLKTAAMLKTDYGVEIDISEITARLRFVIDNMASDEKKSEIAIQKYLSATPTLWSRIQTPLPWIHVPRKLSLAVRFMKIFPPVGNFLLLVQTMILLFINPDKMNKLFGISNGDFIIAYLIFLIFNYFFFLVLTRLSGHSTIYNYLRPHPESVSSNTQASIERLK